MGNSMSHPWKRDIRKSSEGKKKADDSRSPAVVPEPALPMPIVRGNTPSVADNVPPRTSVSENTPPRVSSDGSIFQTEDDNLLSDPDVKIFNDGMKQTTEKVLSSLEQGMRSGVLELSSLKDVTTGLVEMDQDVVKVMLECGPDVWANTEMKELVTEYFDQSLEALDFCGVLAKSVQHARYNQMYIESAMGHMPENGVPNEEECRRILEELDRFVKAENPFSSEFSELFERVYTRQKQLQVKLCEKNKRFHRKERNVRLLKKITTVILTATCVSLVICAAVAMAVAAPIRGKSVSSSAALPFEAMHSWLRNLWSRYEQKIKAERGILDAASLNTWVALKDLETINTEVRRLNGEIDRIIRNIGFGQERGDSLAVQQSVRAIKKGQQQYIEQLEDLNVHVNDCYRRITRGRDIVLERILGNPSTS